MSRLRFLSSTSACLLAFAGCGDDQCGPAGAPATGLVAGSDQLTLTYGAFEGGLNNDCPDPDAPMGLTSMTISGSQTDGTGILTLCVSRPDKLATGKQSLGLDVVASEVHVISVIGTANNCSFAFDRTLPPTGTAEASGLCGNGADPAGFALIVDGALSLNRTCGTTVDKVAVTLRGKVAVVATQ